MWLLKSRQAFICCVVISTLIWFIPSCIQKYRVVQERRKQEKCQEVLNKYDHSVHDYKEFADDWLQDQSRARVLLHMTSNISINTEHVTLCPALWIGNKTVTDFVSKDRSGKYVRKLKTVTDYLRKTINCTKYVLEKGFRQATVIKEEMLFPLAFSVLVYKDIEQVERLLRTIYRPHNVYCVHVDSKAATEFRYSVELIVRCLPNVFLATPSFDVTWGDITTLIPELVCLRLLWHHPVKWRYFINLTGQEFPLKTNRELVRILKAFRGASAISGNGDSGTYSVRWERYLPVPYNLTPIKGGIHIAVSRDYAYYVLFSDVAYALLRWVCPTNIPDEAYFNTLNYNAQLGVPGSSMVNLSVTETEVFTRYKMWKDSSQPCSGKFVRSVCHFGVGDLARMVNSTQLFANKFSYDHQPLGYDCLEAWYFYKVNLENQGRSLPLDLSVYEESNLVRYRYTGPVLQW